jgi:hypothetical protein
MHARCQPGIGSSDWNFRIVTVCGFTVTDEAYAVSVKDAATPPSRELLTLGLRMRVM